MGTYIANNYKIKLEINTSSAYQAFFGVINNATINSLNVEGTIKINKSDNVRTGAVIGMAVSSTIKNCKNYANITVTGGGYICGGIVGLGSEGTTIINCENYGDIDCRENTGGILGYAQLATVKDCTNYGTISASVSYSESDVGGIVGDAKEYATNKIENCINHGNVTGKSHVGGIVGHNNSKAPVINCSNDGIISGSSYAGNISGTPYVN